MRILQVITSLQTGGAEKLIIDIVPRLRLMGHQVDVCLFNGEETPFKAELKKSGCQIYDLSYNSHYFSPIKLLKLWRILRNYDIVHSHNTAPQLFVAISSLLCHSILITTEHNTSNRRRKHKILKVADRWMYNRYNKIICISKQAEYNLREYLGLCRAEIITIFNGIDVESFLSACPDSKLRVGDQKCVVVMVAAFREQKDQDTLVRAFSRLDRNVYELWLVGEGARERKVKELVDKLGLKDSVRFWGRRSDIPTILHTADIVVMSSHYEGLSLSNIEGMSVGKPFIASDVDGLQEMTTGAGLLFPHQDDIALANLITHLHDDPAFSQKVAIACLEKAKQFDISEMVKSYSDVYHSALFKDN